MVPGATLILGTMLIRENFLMKQKRGSFNANLSCIILKSLRASKWCICNGNDFTQPQISNSTMNGGNRLGEGKKKYNRKSSKSKNLKWKTPSLVHRGYSCIIFISSPVPTDVLVWYYHSTYDLWNDIFSRQLWFQAAKIWYFTLTWVQNENRLENILLQRILC